MKDKRKKFYLPISIVVCGKNAASEFAKHLPLLCSQTYQEFEVVVVDDHSSDNTVEVVESLQKQFHQIRLIASKKVPDRPGKKAALYTGVCAAKYEHIVVTDADCIPSSEFWLQHLFSAFKEKTNLVLGVAPNEKESGFWKGLFRFESVQTAMMYVSFALRGMPYMGVGRNMAFKKHFFLTHFVQILNDDIASGDDDLLVNFSAQANTTSLCLHPDSYMYSKSPINFKAWFRQKQRHLSAGFRYQWLHQVLLIAYPLAQMGFVVSGFLLLKQSWLAVLLFFLFQFAVQQTIHSLLLKKLKQSDIALEYPIYQLLWGILQPVITILSYFKSKNQWN